MHEIKINKNLSKEERYIELCNQIESLISDEKDILAILSNITAAIQDTYNFLWVGFYLVKSNELVLGPFQGPVACFRIGLGKGVCGTSWKENKTFIVKDVNKFPGHIACSSMSKSEIVIPIRKNHKVYGVLDIDSKEYNSFDKTDKKYLKKIIAMVENKLI